MNQIAYEELFIKEGGFGVKRIVIALILSLITDLFTA
jgi:hypothetical protein